MRNYDCWQREREQAEVLSCGLKLLKRDTPYLSLMIWKPKGKNPYVNYSFKTVEARDAYSLKQVVNYLNIQKWKKEEKQKEKAKPLFDVKAGDVFYTSWEYDQTNYDFIIVDKISDTGKSCICRRAMAPQIDHTRTTDVLRPIRKGFGDSFRMQITANGVKGSYYFCHDGIGSKRMDYFSHHEAGTRYNQTNPVFGH